MLLQARQAIPEILRCFEHHGIHATWASVGALFCEGREELLECMPAQVPEYDDPLLSFRHYVSELGESERADPFHFAPSLLKEIAATPYQEVACHSFGHYYVLERGASPFLLRADLTAAKAIASRRGMDLHSIVFPRNQFDDESLQVVQELGFKAYRGNRPAWFYAPHPGANAPPHQRAFRLADSYLRIGKSDFNNCEPSPIPGLKNIPASMFLRPYSTRFARFEETRLARIKNGMTNVAKAGGDYHLWWHPHNYGTNTKENFAMLTRILEHFTNLQNAYGMRSLSMNERAHLQ